MNLPKEQQSLFEVLFNHSDDAIIIHDQKGRIIECNQAACSKLNYTKEELLSLTTKDIDAPDFAEGFGSRLAKQVDTGRLRCEGIHLSKDGKRINVDIVTTVINYKGQNAVIAVIRDISDLKQAELERHKLELQIQHSQKLESLGVLAGGIAHDFNNLLMAILGNADLALFHLTPDSPGFHEIEGIQVATRRAAELCQQLLAYSGKGHFVVEAVDINSMLKEMGNLLEVTRSKKVNIVYNLNDQLPAVEADKTQLRQVIMNLISNAAEAIGNNPGIISISSDISDFNKNELDSFVSSGKLTEGKYIVFKVSDTGRGMDQSVQAKIFEPFFSTKQTGRGLGLSAVLGIIRGHKGAIKVESTPQVGTNITILFPPSEHAAVSAEKTPVNNQWKGSGLVLIADDEEIVRSVSANMLKVIGFEVLEAKNGEEAFKIFKEIGEQLRCVILDLSMPLLSGQEVFKEIRKINKKIPIVLCSGYSEYAISAETQGTEKVEFIQKPFQLEALRMKLEKVLK